MVDFSSKRLYGQAGYTPAPLKRLRALLEECPDSAVKSFRAGQPQVEVAAKSGISQAMLSSIETGARQLSPEIARSLAPVLGAEPSQLLAAEGISRLKRMALKSQLDPHVLLEMVLYLDEQLPESQFVDDLLAAMLEALEGALAAHSQQHDEKPSAALKSQSGRDIYGRRTEKPSVALKTSSSEEPEGPRRDALGRRLNKPNAPRS